MDRHAPIIDQSSVLLTCSGYSEEYEIQQKFYIGCYHKVNYKRNKIERITMNLWLHLASDRQVMTGTSGQDPRGADLVDKV